MVQYTKVRKNYQAIAFWAGAASHGGDQQAAADARGGGDHPGEPWWYGGRLQVYPRASQLHGDAYRGGGQEVSLPIAAAGSTHARWGVDPDGSGLMDEPNSSHPRWCNGDLPLWYPSLGGSGLEHRPSWRSTETTNAKENTQGMMGVQGGG